MLLALDWAKAFDSISPEALSVSLKRFGCPSKFVDMVSSIYKDRKFVVTDFAVESGEHTQTYGICQGCPLSPFLFTIIMTTLLSDAHKCLQNQIGEAVREHVISELVYADDTLLVGSNPGTVETLMQCVEKCGEHYGLKLNWQKVEMLRVRSNAVVKNSSGMAITCK